jgi:hypothetical protein
MMFVCEVQYNGVGARYDPSGVDKWLFTEND